MRSDQESEPRAEASKNWRGALMFGLLYPAVLGTFFYSLLPETLHAIRSPLQVNSLLGIKLVLSYLLIAHFLVDFHFTQQVALEMDSYPSPIFALDLLIVLALFVSYDTIHLDAPGFEPEVRWSAGAMFFCYVFFRIWEYKMRGAIGGSRSLRLYETAAAIVFLFLALAWPNVYAFAIALLASALLLFVVAGPVVERFHQAHSSGERVAMNPDPSPSSVPESTHDTSSDNLSPEHQLDVHLAEYSALTNRCTYWLAFQVPIWTALIAFLGLIPLLWPYWDHFRLASLVGIGSQLLVLIWFQTIEEQYRAISYIQCQLRPKVDPLIGTPDFWKYEAFSAGRRDPLNWWGEWVFPAVTLSGLFLLAIPVLRQPEDLLRDHVFVLLLVFNLVLVTIQFLKTWTRVCLRQSISDPLIKNRCRRRLTPAR